MQQKWDNLDQMIIDSEEKFELSDDYNFQVLNKVNNFNKRKQSYISASSLIMAGILVIFLYTSGMESKLIELKANTKYQILFIQSSYKNIPLINKFLKGEF
jgi:hypothetical protein